MSGNTPLPLLPSETQRGKINVVIEVPKGADSKFKYLPEAGAFILHRSLPAGMVFPYDYGFIPSTLGEDGDALDVLVFVDTVRFPGCGVEARLLGVITGTQKGKQRLVAHVDAVSWKK